MILNMNDIVIIGKLTKIIKPITWNDFWLT